jgi:hypothetical protein
MAEKISYYFDEHMSRKVAEQLEKRSCTVIMAVDEGMVQKDDLTEHLTFATKNGLVMVTCDRPFASRAMSKTDHAGLICWTGILDDFGGQTRLLSEFAERHNPEEVKGQVFWIKP